MSFRVALVVIILAALTGCANLIRSQDIELSSGRAVAKNYSSYPIRLGAQFTFLESSHGNLSAGPELINDIIDRPSSAMLTGVTINLRYTYPVCDRVNIFAIGGSGPNYLGAHTDQQANPGFNFIDQVGAGFNIKIIDNLSITAQYRYAHISHAGTRNTVNHGIDSQLCMLGLRVNF
jgi:opacity protein-like surface antigen